MVIEDELARAAAEADLRDRALLTETGQDLVVAVTWALEQLGFSVVDMDTIHPARNRREDLRVTDPDDPGWVALVEVKGVAKGAQESGLYQLGKRHSAFASSEGRAPSRLWYVVNHHRSEDPALRPRPFAGHDDTIAAFAADGGAVIDTRSLNRLIRAVTVDQASARGTRNQLKTALGVMTDGDIARP